MRILRNSCTDRVWDCSAEWGACTNGEQTRQCVSNCDNDKTEIQQCNIEAAEVTLGDEEPEIIEDISEPGAVEKFLSVIIGGVTGAGATSVGIAGIFLVLVVGGLVVVVRKKRKRK